MKISAAAITAIILFLGYSQSSISAMPVLVSPRHSAAEYGSEWVRTELYFGGNKPDGSTVNSSEWQNFVDGTVTPRFPEGFTVLTGYGQYRGNDGVIVHEESKVLIILYSRKQRKAADIKIEEIRSEYKRRFLQESVLRIDLTRSVRVDL